MSNPVVIILQTKGSNQTKPNNCAFSKQFTGYLPKTTQIKYTRNFIEITEPVYIYFLKKLKGPLPSDKHGKILIKLKLKPVYGHCQSLLNHDHMMKICHSVK